MNLGERLKRLYNDFFNLGYFDVDEGEWFPDVATWIEERRKAKERFRELFLLDNLEYLEEEDFKKFLFFKYNYAWTKLYRTGLQALNDFERVKEAIRFLQNEDIDIITRIREVVDINGRYHVRGIGRNIATGILHTVDDKDRYGVWNNVVERALRKLNVFPKISADPGITYYRINEVLNYLKKIINSDLLVLDSLLWFIDKYT